MSVYVDRERNRFGRMVMCHMFADSLDELHSMAQAIGMDRDWFQPLSFPHYDVSLSRRAVAVSNGAIEVDRRTGYEIRKRVRAAFTEADIAHLRAALPAYDARRARRLRLTTAAGEDAMMEGAFIRNEYGLWCPNCQERIDEFWPVSCDHCGYPAADYDRFDQDDYDPLDDHTPKQCPSFVTPLASSASQGEGK